MVAMVPRKRSNLRSKLPRAVTESMKRFTKAALERGRVEYPEHHGRPRVRLDCIDTSRPCPYVGCRYHLYLDVHPRTGAIKYNFPHLEPHELPYSCALDVADLGGLTLESVGELTNLTRERVRQVERMAMDRLQQRYPRLAIVNEIKRDD